VQEAIKNRSRLNMKLEKEEDLKPHTSGIFQSKEQDNGYLWFPIIVWTRLAKNTMTKLLATDLLPKFRCYSMILRFRYLTRK
jgi:hypothetical protein